MPKLRRSANGTLIVRCWYARGLPGWSAVIYRDVEP